MSPDLFDTFTYTNKNECLYVIETLKKGSYKQVTHEVTLPAIPALGIEARTFSVTRHAGSVSQRTYFGIFAKISQIGWNANGVSTAMTPRACDPDGPARIRRDLVAFAEQAGVAHLESKIYAEWRASSASASTAVGCHIKTLASSAGLLAPGDDPYYGGASFDNTSKQPVDVVATALSALSCHTEVYRLAAKYLVAKGDQRELEALLKAAQQVGQVNVRPQLSAPEKADIVAKAEAEINAAFANLKSTSKEAYQWSA